MRGGRNRAEGLYLMQRSVPATPRDEVRAGASVPTQSAVETDLVLRACVHGLDGLGLGLWLWLPAMTQSSCDSACWRWLPSSPTHRPAVVVCFHDSIGPPIPLAYRFLGPHGC
jgi:hypothetical protein